MFCSKLQSQSGNYPCQYSYLRLNLVISVRVNAFWTDGNDLETCRVREINFCDGCASCCDTPVYFPRHSQTRNKQTHAIKRHSNGDITGRRRRCDLSCAAPRLPDKRRRHLGFDSFLISCCPSLLSLLFFFFSHRLWKLLPVALSHALSQRARPYSAFPRLLFNRSLPPWWTVIS